MEELNKLTAEIISMRTDIVYLVRLVEKLSSKVDQLEKTVNKPTKPSDPFAGMRVEKL
jgi:hypothetical protein